MAIGTPGGKVGCLAGPTIALVAMFYSVDWFGITEDGQEYLGLFAWLILGGIVALASGLLIRSLLNRLLTVDVSKD